MKVLHLPLKAEWFKMIEAGLKPEDYREITDYWRSRLMRPTVDGSLVLDDEYTHVLFRYGYTKRTLLFELKNIEIGKGKSEFGAPDHDVFIIKLGDRAE